MENDTKEVLSKADWYAIEDLRVRGFLVIIWTPEELEGTTNLRHLEDRIIELGNEVIDYSKEA